MSIREERPHSLNRGAEGEGQAPPSPISHQEAPFLSLHQLHSPSTSGSILNESGLTPPHSSTGATTQSNYHSTVSEAIEQKEKDTQEHQAVAVSAHQIHQTSIDADRPKRDPQSSTEPAHTLFAQEVPPAEVSLPPLSPHHQSSPLSSPRTVVQTPSSSPRVISPTYSPRKVSSGARESNDEKENSEKEPYHDSRDLLGEESNKSEAGSDYLKFDTESQKSGKEHDCLRFDIHVQESEPESDYLIYGPMADPDSVRRDLEDQNHYWNCPDAMNRQPNLIQWAKYVVNGARGSPTAKEKTRALQYAARDMSRKGESDFQNAFLDALLNHSRMVPKVVLPAGQKLEAGDYDPRLWSEDCLDRRTQVHFREGSVPQYKPPPGSYNATHKTFRKLEKPEPDVAYGIGAKYLDPKVRSLFDKYGGALAKELYHIFLAGDMKTNNRPLPEAENQTMRAGSAMTQDSYNWNLNVEGKPFPDVNLEPEKGSGASTADQDSATFTAAIAPNVAELQVHWREEWNNGAVYWHATTIKTYSLICGQNESTAAFQSEISNILDWGVGKRAEKIFTQAQTLYKRKAGDDELVMPGSKRARMGRDSDDDNLAGV